MINGPALALTSAADFPFFLLFACHSVRHSCLAEFQNYVAAFGSSRLSPAKILILLTAYRSAGDLPHGLTIMVSADSSLRRLKLSSGKSGAGFPYAFLGST